jgi:hypothetical protein
MCVQVLMLQQEARTHELKGAFSRDYWAICAFGCNVSRKVGRTLVDNCDPADV